ncbi:hypothetical protein [Deinococcus pimensis]|uniref:hypothetical protein n=1 Tax=Deinococcus pimensis TaxID=309888 RepID=UPI0012FCEAF9|nr:hypothetical protein [Deinococcus pimensis]
MDDERSLAERQERGEIVISPDAQDREGEQEANESPTERAVKFQQHQEGGIVPDDEDG